MFADSAVALAGNKSKDRTYFSVMEEKLLYNVQTMLVLQLLMVIITTMII